ncbi:hypothetical protein [Agriterribacter sp.]|uniref:hypothetical protein n=1 Tax=Agriterribacter sp. TaxID=2821509 RepID=UPI002C6E57AE|nr:hypothetical protein [Agriterribacter sp.]HRO44788.1 hypothetical protein [Agriterribacter sp.]HRQ18127.1 hypothetical protein [Agriterribacter sp.]
MTQAQLATMLESITGHLTVTGQDQERQLQQARERIAASLVSQKMEDTGTEHLFANSNLYSRDNIKVSALSSIADISTRVARTTAPVEAMQGESIFVRSVPILNAAVAGSVPDWAAGAKPAETFGPFLNNEGREIWIDIYRYEKLITLYIGTQPALLFKASFRQGRILFPGGLPAELATTYTIVAGSCWISAKFLSAAAPGDRFVGVAVKGGSIQLSLAPTIQNNQITLNPAVNIQVSLKLAQHTDEGAAETSPYGRDAREATYQLPEIWEFSWQNNKCTITQVGPATGEIYGQAVAFGFTPASSVTPAYNNNQVLIPWKTDVNEFSIFKYKSPWTGISGKALIQKSWWAFPAATLNINNPVQATGNGVALLQCGEGWRMTWNGLQNEDVRLKQPVISGKPGEIVITDMEADALGASHHLELWKDDLNPHGTTADIVLLEKAPLIFIINSKNAQELLITGCAATIYTDRPVKVNGEPFPVQSSSCHMMLSAGKTGRRIMLMEEDMQADQAASANAVNIPGAAPAQELNLFSIALENALFTVSPVKSFILIGECDDAMENVIRGNCIFIFSLYSYLPTLPDPYIANLGLWRRGVYSERYNRIAGANGINSLLICVVSFIEAEDQTDEVSVDFYFGGNELPDLLTLPEKKTAAKTAKKTTAAVRSATALSRKPSGVVATAVKKPLFGSIATAVRLTAESFAPEIVAERFPGVILKEEPSMNTDLLAGFKNANGAVYSPEELFKMKKDVEDVWDSGLQLQREFFSLLDVSSNANQLGVSFGADWQLIRTGSVRGADGEVHSVDYNANTWNNAFPFLVEGMQVKLPANRVRAFTLPLMAWEPEINLTPPDRDNPLDPNSPKLLMDPEAGFLYYADDGGPARMWNNNQAPVPLAPIPVTNGLVEDFKSQPGNYTLATFTLPFGMKAISYISKHFVEPQKPAIENIRPKFRKNEEDNTYKLEGGIQISLQAGRFGKPNPANPTEYDSDMFPGYTVQANNLLNWFGMASYASNLGHRVTEIFNNEFLFGPLSLSSLLKDSRGVPVSRMDITGYGASMFSNWLSPGAAMAQTSQARFDVMLGRTGHEVIQVKSIIYPWGIRVVRTITVFRTGSGYVFRTDSGWKAESDGLFDFSYSYLKKGKDPFAKLTLADFENIEAPYEFHPGIIRGLFNVRNIKDAPSVTEYTSENIIAPNADYVNGVKGQMYTNGATQRNEPVKCGGVYFDADVEIENVVQGHINKRVVSKRVLGYVQVAPAGKPLTAEQLKALLQLQNGSIGGEVDCVLDINKSNQQVRVNRFDLSASINKAGTIPVFVVAARGNVFLPKDGSWAMVQHNAGTGEVIPLPQDVTVPLIRTAAWKKGNVVDAATLQQKLVRIAHPLEILRDPSADTINFGYLQTTATQKALFLTPAYGLNVDKMLSKTPPIFADAYRLMTGNGIFPNIGNAITDFGKTIPLLNSKDANGNTFQAFVENALEDGGEKVLELMKVEAEKAGEAVIKQGMSMLKNGANGVLDKALKFDVPSFEIPLVDTEALRIYIEYKTGKKTDAPANYVDSKLNFDVDSFAGDMADQWKSRMNNLAMVVDLGDMKRLMTIKGNFDAQKGKESSYEGGSSPTEGIPTPEIEFSDALQPVIDILQMLASLSSGDYGEALKKGLKLAMSNSGEIWEYKFEATKEIALIRFPPTDELYNSAQTPLKLEASLSVGVYFNAALKVTSDPSQLLPTAGAFLQFHGGLQIMCYSVGVGSIYAIGAVDVKIAADTKVGPSLTLKFGFGVSIVVSLPVVGNASVTFMVGVEMYADKDKVVLAALMLFRGQANLLGGLVCVCITIEAKGIVVRQGGKTDCSAQVTFAIDISIFLVIDISFSKTWGEDRQVA